jgi:hypothetical protein
MKVVVFVGPTLAGDSVLAREEFEWRPPAAEGDLYRAVKGGASAVGLIDGRFETVPSVWHKEILWALSRGVPVFGAASMGALRAAELADFGMTGVGAIWRAYRDGTIRDDDEVAVLHAPRELGFRSLTEAMVDIRATVARAQTCKIISARTAAMLLAIAKSLFFKDRTWPAILAEAERRRLPPAQRVALARWLPGHRVGQKRRDALAMLRAMKRTAGRPTVRLDFHFERTEFWRSLVTRHSAGPSKP